MLSPGLSCARADLTLASITTLAGRAIDPIDRGRVREELVRRYQAGDVDELDALDALATEMHTHSGPQAAVQRSHALWRLRHGEGPLTEADGVLWNILWRAVSLWEQHDGDELVLTEADIEGWIHYASLCSEVQGTGTLHISVADRVGLYRIVQDRFQQGDRADREAMGAIGPFWTSIRSAWKSGSYDLQQRWIGRAPLPPKMLASPKGFLAAVLDGDLPAHVRVLHDTLGPFKLP